MSETIETTSWNAMLSGEGWQGEMWVSTYSDGHNHVLATVMSDKEATALNAVTGIYNMMAGGRVRYVRRCPKASSDVDFDTGEKRIQGHVRFSFTMEPGDEQIAVPRTTPHGFGSVP